MPIPQSPLPRLQLDGYFPQSPRDHRRKSSEFGWFDIEPLLSARTTSTQPALWGDEDDMQEECTSPGGGGGDSALPRALARVFHWLEEVEGPHNTSSVDEAIIDADALLALRAPSSPVRRDNDEVVTSKAVTKADFCLASREQPSLAIGIYAHRVVRRNRWLFWSECYAEYLVVIGTETELLRAWRCYSDFSSLAETATALGARAVTAYWDKLDRAMGGRRTTDPVRLRNEVRCLGHFLTTMLEELRGPNTGILVDFVREPTTYVVVGVENVGCDTINSDDGDERFAGDVDGTVSNTQPARKKAVFWGSDWCYLGGRTLGSEPRHPMKRKRTEQPLKPEPQVWDGL